MQQPEDSNLIQLGDHIEGLIEAWTLATNEERHQLLTMMLDAVFVDMQLGTIEGVKPNPEFLPLFNLAEPVRAGETVLVTALLDSASSPSRTRIRRPRLILSLGCLIYLDYAASCSSIREFGKRL